MNGEPKMPAPDADNLVPHMSRRELELFDRHIPFGGNVLEFGCGGSSPHFLSRGVRLLTSVESDKTWLETLIHNPVMRHFFLKNRWIPIHVDIGPTELWGNPASSVAHTSWLKYHTESWGSMPDTAYDLILIDGRFRVACFCQSLLRCANASVRIIMHDFWDRPSYHAVLEFSDVLDRAGSFAALRAKRDLDWKRLCLVLQEYQFDPD